MNIVCIPYHDWRKIEKEGYRTRDSHVIHHLDNNESIDKILIVNRPTTITEIILKRKKISLSGVVIYKKGNFKVYKISEKAYVLDYISNDLLGPLIKRKKWFIDSYGDPRFIELFRETLRFLQIDYDILFTQNVFSINFAASFSNNCIFDAWDNFLLFPDNIDIKNELKSAYEKFSHVASLWITNSLKNISFYKTHYSVKECVLVKNGVDIERFDRSYNMPNDLKAIDSPRIGFGGKITHLFDYELFNYCVDQNPGYNFIIIGQILDKKVFSKISKSKNVHYLGDKHYEEYPAYVTNFEVGIVPYVTNVLEHGADSIKVYEYIAAGLRVVGTSGAGMADLTEYILIAKDKFEFSALISTALEKKEQIKLPEFHTWKYKVESIVEVFESLVAK